MGGIGEAALMRKSRDRNVYQRRLPQQVFEQFDTQMKDVAFERGRAVGEDTMKGPFRNAELGGKRRRRPDRGNVCPQVSVDQPEQTRAAESMASAGGKAQYRREISDDVRLALSCRCVRHGDRVAYQRGNRARNRPGQGDGFRA
jgi:hypothetical protein